MGRNQRLKAVGTISKGEIRRNPIRNRSDNDDHFPIPTAYLGRVPYQTISAISLSLLNTRDDSQSHYSGPGYVYRLDKDE